MRCDVSCAWREAGREEREAGEERKLNVEAHEGSRGWWRKEGGQRRVGRRGGGESGRRWKPRPSKGHADLSERLRLRDGGTAASSSTAVLARVALRASTV